MRSQVYSVVSLLFVIGVVLAACAAPAAPVAQPTPVPPTMAPAVVPPTPAPTTPPTTGGGAPAAATVAMLTIAKDDTLGQFLADDQGRTLYLFTKDTKDTSNCYDACATNWPPLLSADQPKGGEGIDASLLGTTQRKDGSMQVTYNGYPLYYYIKDAKPGDIIGQGVGNVWYVISPAGALLKPATVKVVENAKLGQFLADDQGRTLYMYTKDDKNVSNCYDKCATAWPPLLSAGQPKGLEGINASLLGTTQRKDGSMQVTYNGYPLYYYTPDAKPGDVNGQDVGKVWYVLSPSGDMITTSMGS